MKKRVTTFIAAVLTVMLTFTFFSIPVSADNGPKPSVILTIDDPPDEEYYVDLLYFYDDNDNYQYQGNAKVENFAKINCDLEMVKLLLSVKENTENYHFCRLYFADSGLIWKSTPEYQSGENQYEFVRSALRPQMDNFKIVMVTKSKKLYISDMIHKTAFYSEITYNPETNQWHESHLADIQDLLTHFGRTLLTTLLIEGILLFFFFVREIMNMKTLGKNGKNILVFVITNVVTQIFLYLSLYLFGYLLRLGENAYLLAETVIVVSEAVVYFLLFTPKHKVKFIIYAIIANLSSFLSGEVLWLVFDYPVIFR